MDQLPREIFPKGGWYMETLSFLGDLCSIAGLIFAVYVYIVSVRKEK